MMNILKIAKKTVNSIGVKTRQFAPEIFMGAGIVTFVGTIVLACRETMEADEILEEHRIKMEKIEEAVEAAEHMNREYNEGRDKLIAYSQTVVAFAKLYAPAVAVGTISLGCILVSNKILKGRYLAAVTAYNTLTEVFKTYRKRVIEEEGADADRHYRFGTARAISDKVTIDEKGKEKVTQENVEIATDWIPSDYAKYFDETNPNWDENPEFSLMFLKAVEKSCNMILEDRGHIFLNEVYDQLGFKHTDYGALVGWMKGNGDDYVDFGLYDHQRSCVRKFINGEDNVILLDFNCDGVILNKL